MMLRTMLLVVVVASRAGGIETFAEKYWEGVRCGEYYFPEDCDFSQIPQLTLDDYERCGPARVPYLYGRNYFLGTGGKGITYRENVHAYNRIQINPRVAHVIQPSSLEVMTLGQRMNFPIGLSPSASHRLAHPDGEIATVTGAVMKGALMILSSLATTSLEDVAAAARGSDIHLWMQLYILRGNRTSAVDLVRRAERNGFEAIVVTVDYSPAAKLTCNAGQNVNMQQTPVVNFGRSFGEAKAGPATFADITWLTTITNLPIVAKGVLRADDARLAAMSGASAIFVSNHGGRQMDSDPATIDALPHVVAALKPDFPDVDVYVDGGIRTGRDVFKAIARGAKMAFIGRPVIWGIAVGGAGGLKNVLDILVSEFNETMLLSGALNPYEITSDMVSPYSYTRRGYEL